MDPRGTVGSIYEGKESIIHWPTQHMKALDHMVSEKIFFMFFCMTPPRRDAYGPEGHGWEDL